MTPPDRGSGSAGNADSSRVTRVELPVDTRAPGGTTNAYLANGLLVDPAAQTDRLDAAVAAHARSTTPADLDEPGAARAADSPGDARIDAIAVTHTHPDHVGAVADYAERTGAVVYAHAGGVDRFRDATGVTPDATFRDGDAVGTTGVRVLATPGHAPDHVAFGVGLDDKTVAAEALVGDLAVAEGSVVVGAPDGDIRAYLDSLERVRDAGFDRLYPGHGPRVDEPSVACQRLIDHRLARETAVAEAVAAGAPDIDAVLEAAYEKELAGVEDLARATVRAHLETLAAEGRIDEAWRAE